MNDNATLLLEQLGGIGSIDEAAEQSSDLLLGSLSTDSDNQDRWHLLMVELAYILNASFQDAHYWEGVKSKQDTFLQFINTMHQLDRMQGHDKTVRINYRGSHLTDLSAKLDYIIQFGEQVVDYNVVSELIKRQGLRFKHFEGRIKKAFAAFAEQAISNVSLKIPGRSQRSLEMMQISMRIFSCYNQAAETLTPITFEKNGKECSLPPIVDEFNQPDPNLTLVAALNNLSESTMQGLVRKVAPMDAGNNDEYSEEQYSSVYQTFFKVKSLRDKLIKPPLEVNSNKSLAMFMNQGETAPDEIVIENFDNSTARRANLNSDPAVLKHGVAQFAKAAFKGSVQHAKLAMKSVFAQDYNQVNLKILGQRFKLLSRLLNTMEKNSKGQKILDSVLATLQTAIDQVPDELLDDLVVQDDLVKFWSGEQETVIGEVDINLLDVLEVSKGRCTDRKRSISIINPYENIEYEDYQVLAERFDITVVDAEQIISLFENCFDKRRNFQRAAFAKNVPDFMRFEKHSFQILWEFLKKTQEDKDRVPFLNSLQLLVKESQQHLKAIKLLLSDFIMNPSAISFSDRNAIMLANQFLRTYNKEINMDIEITPEEVLLVIVGLDRKVAGYASWRVDGEQRKFLNKIIMIRKKLLEALDANETEENLLPIRFLLALEREVHIFLALAGGQTAAMVLRSALKVYGNPGSQVYCMKESAGHMTYLVQNLTALIRGFGRVGNTEDQELLDEIKEYKEGFLDLGRKDPRHEALIERIMGWIDMAKNEISSRPPQAAIPEKKDLAGQQQVPISQLQGPDSRAAAHPG
ncbi:hypothetical protein D1BOALGB6SA_8143 [Olavius sp. associated proteobacterium Delta 1]|nr:hypothetical protein D1BOALGB6SA_8143 [Olavius sp. associated proteobacterium Delta 1]